MPDLTAAVRQVTRHLPANRFVLRTDVKAYYASNDHFPRLDQVAGIIGDKRVLNLLGQYLRRTAERGATRRWRDRLPPCHPSTS